MLIRYTRFKSLELRLLVKDDSYIIELRPLSRELESCGTILERYNISDDYKIEEAIKRFKEIEIALLTE